MGNTQYTEGECTVIQELGDRAIGYALLSEAILKDLLNFRIGNEIVGTHVSVTVTTRYRVEEEGTESPAVVGET